MTHAERNARTQSHRTCLAALILATAALAVLALAPGASAALRRSHEGSFPTVTSPSSVAVNDVNGDTYVADPNNFTVSRYDSQGNPKNFTCAPGPGCNFSGNTLTGFTFSVPGAIEIAVDKNSGRVYVTDSANGVMVFDQTGQQIADLNGASTPNGAFAIACGVAVDQSTGEVYVDDINDFTNGIVWRYTPSGGTIAESGYSGGLKTPAPTCNVAAAQGHVYASETFDLGDGNAGIVYGFSDSDFTAPGPNASPTTTPIGTGASALAADPTSADAYVDQGNQVAVADSAGNSLYSFGSGDFSTSTGVAVRGFGGVYVSDADHNEIDTYTPPLQPGTRHHLGSFPTVTSPSSVAVNDVNGDTYVADPNNFTVSRYDSQGNPKNFTCAPGPGCNFSGNTLTGFTFSVPGAIEIAVDKNSGRVYVTDSANGVMVFDQTGQQIADLNGASTPNGAFAIACGVAVDQSTGEVYVDDINDFTNGIVWRYTPSGGTIAESGYSGGLKTPAPTCNVAAAQGHVYASETFDLGDGNAGIVYGFSDSDFTAPGPNASPTTTPIGTGASALAADPTSADAYVDQGNQVAVADSAGNSLYSFGSGDFSTSTGVAVSASGNSYVSDADHNQIDVYGPFTLPAVTATTTPGATSITSTTAVLAGTVKTDSALTDCHFDYVDDADYDSIALNPYAAGGTASCVANPDPSSVPVDVVSFSLKHLTPGTTYHFRTSATNTGGSSHGADQTFTTLTSHTLTVATNGSGAGTVTSSPAAISCGSTCQADIDDGTVLTLSGDAASPYTQPVSWTGCDSVNVSNQCVVTMDAAKGVTATFALYHYQLTVFKGGSGAGTVTGSPIACGATCQADLDHGTVITLSATPAAGSEFAGWSGGGCSGTGDCQITIAQAANVLAQFRTAQSVTPPPPPPPTGRFSVGAPSGGPGSAMTLPVTVPGAGSLLATGKGLRRATAHASVAGDLSLTLRLSAAGRRALAKAHRLAVAVTLTFTLADGTATTATKTVTFKAKAQRHHKRSHRRANSNRGGSQ